ncbi:MAG: phosphomannomutase [Fibrobacter sp.]|nr:phosphomannomutase [Fibrobacter sp.]
MTSQEPAKVSFGTSGWRGEIGSEFTLRNLQVVGAAIVRLYKEATPELFEALGVKDFAELQKRGVVVGHDNRLLGHEFCEAVADQFAKAGVKVYYGGEMPTPEFSAAIEMLGAACSINMTPSHNPSHYNGIKFNPADGGPAGPEITNVITKLSNEMMPTWKFEPVSKVDWEIIDSLKIYKEFLVKQGTIKFDRIKEFIKKGRLTLVCDHVHGSTRRRPAALLDNPECLITLRNEDDSLFGGIAPEPSSKNLGEYLDALYEEYGRFYPTRSGFEVDKSLVGAPLKAKVDAIADIAKPGAKVMVGANEKTVKQLLTLDGVKVIFDDDSWMLVRPSGTEPKVRIYTECRNPDEKDPMFEAAKALFFKN